VHDRRRVVDAGLIGVDEADDGDEARAGGSGGVEGAPAVLDEARAQEQVFRRVAGDRQLRKRDDVDAGLPGAGGEIGNQPDVTVEVADGGVELGEANAKYAHASVLSVQRALSTLARRDSA